MRILLIIILLLPISSFAKQVEVVAKVGEGIITNLDLDKRISLMISSAGMQDSNELRQKVARKALKKLINESIQYQYAQKLGISVSKAELNDGFERIATSNKKKAETFAKHLIKNGISIQATLDNLEAQILWQKIIVNKVRPSIKVTDKEVEDRLSQIKSQMQGREVELFEILITVGDSRKATKKQMDRISKKLRKGDDIRKLAQQYSESPSAAKGGKLGWINIAQLKPEIQEKIMRSAKKRLTLKAEYNDVIEAYRMLHIDDVRKTDKKITREDVKKYLLMQRIERAGEKFMNDLYKQTYIEIVN